MKAKMDVENRNEKYSREDLESFVNGIISASKSMRYIHSRSQKTLQEIDNPYYVVNLHGSLPLFDVLTIVDQDIDVDRAVYFPGSSRIQNSSDILRYCFENFLWEKQYETDKTSPLFSIDEVVGGHSVERVVNAYNSAIRRIATQNLRGTERRKRDIEEVSFDLKQQFPLYIFGIRDLARFRNRIKNRENMNKRYLELSNPRNENRVIYEFPVKKIITMDDPDFELIEFKHPTSSGWKPSSGYYPKIDSLKFSHYYMDLLHDIARIVGVNPETVDPSRARIRTHCERYSKKPAYN
ncbi:hypothetical protein J4221_06120 [Candidatus Pacearchaeota archaeon]|nr:hypothetical protein [Candidatus Pacearchaeota archaeon]